MSRSVYGRIGMLRLHVQRRIGRRRMRRWLLSRTSRRLPTCQMGGQLLQDLALLRYNAFQLVKTRLEFLRPLAYGRDKPQDANSPCHSPRATQASSSPYTHTTGYSSDTIRK